MIITIDGKELNNAQVSGNNLEEMLTDLYGSHVAMNRTIVEVRVNGETYQEGFPHAAAAMGREAIGRLEILTRSPREVAIHFMDNAPALVAQILGVLPEIEGLLRIGDAAGANELFVNFLNSFQLLVKILPQMDSVFPGFLHQESVGHPSLADQLESVNAILTTILDAQGASDWAALAEALESDLAPALDRMGKTLGALQGWVEGR